MDIGVIKFCPEELTTLLPHCSGIRQWGYAVIEANSNKTYTTYNLPINFVNYAMVGVVSGASVEPSYNVENITLNSITIGRTEHTAGQANARWLVIGK